MSEIVRLREIISKSDNIVFFGGAGVSTESNIPDFRSEEGLYNTKSVYKHSPEEILSTGFFKKDTESFYKFYKESILYLDAKPNDAHITLAMMEQMGKLKAIITQNIDGLHQKAGSKVVLELHGSVYRNHCTNCGKFFDIVYVNNAHGVPLCNECNKLIKPDVVLYGEGLNNEVFNTAAKFIEKADTLIVGGTSLVVYPAAGLIKYFKGKNLVLINQLSTPYDESADLIINGLIGEVLKKTLERI